MRKWRGGFGGGGGDDKGLVVQQRCRGPSVFLIGPICLWQADLRRRMGLKYDTDFLHLQSTASESGGMCFVPVKHEAELCLCLQYGPGYFRTTSLLSRTAQDFDTLVFSVLVGRCLTEVYACKLLMSARKANIKIHTRKKQPRFRVYNVTLQWKIICNNYISNCVLSSGQCLVWFHTPSFIKTL